jgi:hypothetical protein
MTDQNQGGGCSRIGTGCLMVIGCLALLPIIGGVMHAVDPAHYPDHSSVTDASPTPALLTPVSTDSGLSAADDAKLKEDIAKATWTDEEYKKNFSPPTPPPSTKGFTIVDSPTQADSTHIYFTQNEMINDYKRNPKMYAAGWKKGWLWASKRDSSDLNEIDKKWDMLDKLPEIEGLGFQAACFVIQGSQSAAIIAQAGPSPELDPWSGICGGSWAENAIKKQLPDPGSYQVVRFYAPYVTKHAGKGCWVEEIVFRAKNAFGGYQIQSAYVYMLDNRGIPNIVGVDIQ